MRSELKNRILKIQNLFFLAIIFFLPTQLGKHFWPSFAIVAGARIDYLSPTLYVTDILILLLILVWVLTIKTANTKQTTPLSPLPWVFIGLLVLGALSAKQPLAAFYGMGKLAEFTVFGYITSRLLQDKKLLQQTILVFAASMALQSSLAIAQFFNHGSIGGLLYFLGERTFTADTPGIANASINGTLVLRPYGTLPHPNVLAGYLLIGIQLVFSISHFPFSIIKKQFFYLTTIISSIAIFLSLSRIAIFLWSALILIQIARYIIKSNGKCATTKWEVLLGWKMAHGKLVILLICFITILLLSPLPYRFLATSWTEDAFVQRLELTKSTLDMIRDHPLLGVGLQNFIITLPHYHTTRGAVLLLQPVHNIFLLIAAETGLLCFGIFLWFLWKTYRRLLHNKTLSLFLNYQFSTLNAILLLGMFDHYFLSLQQGRLLFSFVIGLCWLPAFGLYAGKNIRKKAAGTI